MLSRYISDGFSSGLTIRNLNFAKTVYPFFKVFKASGCTVLQVNYEPLGAAFLKI